MLKLRVILLLVFFCLSSCKRYETNGYIFNGSEGAIAKGETTKSDVLRIMGSPSFKDETGYYYIYLKEYKIAFFDPKTVEYKGMLIGFDESDIVNNILFMDRLDQSKYKRASSFDVKMLKSSAS